MTLLACALAAEGQRVEMITFYSGGEFEAEVSECGVHLHRMHKQGRWDLLGFGTRLVRTIRKHGGGVVVGFLEGANILLSVSKPLLNGRKVVNRLASTYMDPGRYNWLSGWSFGAELRFARRADLVIANSSAGTKRARQAGVPAAKVALVPNAVDSVRFRRNAKAAADLRGEWGVGEGDRVVGIVGRLDPMKDHVNFVAAAEIVLQTLPGVFFVCVGGGSDRVYEEEVRRRAERLLDLNRIMFLGFRSDLAGIYSAIDVNVLSSSGEGSPNSVIESMACGTTCVVTDVGDARRLVGDTGTVVPEGDSPKLAEGILYQMERITAHPDLGAAARDRVLAEHSVASCVNSFRAALASMP